MGRGRMRWLAGLVIASACAGPETARPAPAANASTPAPALADIPRAAERTHGADGDMRTLEPYTGDLDALIERGTIRVLVPQSRTHFQVVNGSQRGRTVDAVAAFEQFLNRRIAPRSVSFVLVPSSETSLVADVVAGQADIAASLLRTFERDDQVAFATPWRTGVRELIVTGPGTPPLVSLEDVGGRTVHVRRNSDHHASLLRLNDQLKKIDRPPARVALAAESQTDEDLLELVNAGKIPATLVDDYLYDAWKSTFDKTAANRDVAVSQDGAVAWVTRKESVKLLELINEFFGTHRLSF
jgi:membrane-bound lytic murein transglycosylase MltF